MAYLVATANGNFTAAATWKLCNGTLFTDSEAGSAAVPAAWTGPTAGQTPGAITIDGIAVKIHSRVASPTGTFSVRLYNVTDVAVVAGTTVTVNVSDILVATTGANGWMFFAFAAPVLLIAAKAYRVEAICTVAGEVTLYRDGTANNWAKLIRTTTTQAPAAGDNLFVLGEWTAAATMTTRTVTMDSTATTDYGDGVENALAKVGISNGGTLAWGTTAATNYRLRVSGYFAVWAGGLHTMGTVATPCPRDSSMELQFDVVTTNLAFGMLVWGTFVAQGLSRTSGKNVWHCNLNATTLSGAATWNVDTDTGWLNGDEVLIAATRTTAGQSERLTLSGAAGASSFTTTTNAANIHDGTGTVAAKVLLITRNVRITNVTTTRVCFGVHTLEGGSTDCDWVLFQRCLGTTTGTLASMGVSGDAVARFDFCFLGDCAMSATLTGVQFNVAGYASFRGTLAVTACGMGNNQGTSGTTYQFYMAANSEAALATVATDQVYVVGGTKATATETFAQFLQIMGAWTNIELWATVGTAVVFVGNSTRRTVDAWTFTNIHLYCVASAVAISTTAEEDVRLGTVNAYRCNTGVLTMASSIYSVEINGGTWIGNTGTPLQIGSAGRIVARNILAKGETGFTAQYFLSTVGNGDVRLENVETGGAGANENFTTSTFNLSSVTVGPWTWVNCKFNEPTIYPAANTRQLVVRVQRAQQVNGNHYTLYASRGFVRIEQTVFRTAAPSERLELGDGVIALATPGMPLPSTPRRIAVRAGFKVQIDVYVRKDGAYNGTQPRLKIGANAAVGHDLVTTGDTMTAGADTWELLTATVPASVAEEDGVITAWIEADGSAGNVYVDDWAASEV